MWGQTLVEASLQQNFNFGFSTYKSDILLHLSQWQYWWWFWFSLVWVAYYYIIVYALTRRTFAFNPVINTSLRGHGKWGDFLVALIPLSWCGNILINSNFILRMIEWQNESSLFTLRVQGKQWYWVYKFDSAATSSILAAPKNVGHNKWIIWTPNDVLISDSYYQALHLANQLEFQDSYKTLLAAKDNLQTSLDQASLISNRVVHDNSLINSTNNIITKNIKTLVKFNLTAAKQKYIHFPAISISPFVEFDTNLWNDETFFFIDTLEYINLLDKAPLYVEAQFDATNLLSSHFDFIRVDDTSATSGNIRPFTASQPLRFTKTPLNLFNLENLTSTSYDFLIKPHWNLDSDSVSEKVYQSDNFWMFRQKKYKRLIKFLFKSKLSYDPITYQGIDVSKNVVSQACRNLSTQQFLASSATPSELSILKPNLKVFKKNSVINTTQLEANLINNHNSKKLSNNSQVFDYYKAVRNAKSRTEMLSVTLARRLLRVKQTLVLPAHVNITVITNSYDVVHSWFIPGLGLKMDCVPGRSTHHTFYVDNIGFYYGQCAEICGRYHHHMPIRICALSFDQFLVWWQKKGLTEIWKLNTQGSTHLSEENYFNPNAKSVDFSATDKISSNKSLLYKYNW